MALRQIRDFIEASDVVVPQNADPIVALGRELDRLNALQEAAEARNDADTSDALGLQINAVEDAIETLVPTSIIGVRLQLELLCRVAWDFEWDENTGCVCRQNALRPERDGGAVMSAPNDLKLIRAIDVLCAVGDLVEGIYLAAESLDNKSERSAITRMADLASARIEKAKRKIYRYREKCEEPAT